MSRLEQLRPKLISSAKITETVSGLILESPTRGPLILPRSAMTALPLLDGTLTVQEVIDRLHHQRGQVEFRALFTLIEKLDEAHYLEPGPPIRVVPSLLKLRTVLEQKPWFFRRVLLEYTLSRKVETGRARPAIFALLAVVVFAAWPLLFAAGSFGIPSAFLRVSGGYLLSLPYLIAATSLLLTLRHLFSTILLLSLAGRAYRLDIALSPLSVSLKIDGSTAHLAPSKRSQAIFYLLGPAFIPVCAAALAAAMPELGNGGSLVVIAGFLTFHELTPYAKSDLTELFSLFSSERDLSQAAPYLRNRSLAAVFGKGHPEERWLQLYSLYAIAWTGSFLFFTSFVAARCFPGLWLTIRGAAALGDAAAATLILCGISIFIAYLTLNLAATLIRNVLYPLTSAAALVMRDLRGRKASRPSDETILRALKSSDLFQGLSGTTLDRLVKACAVRSYGRGVALLIQGQGNDKLFVLLEGTAYVARRSSSGARSRLAELEAGALVGEISALEGSPATADVVTSGRCRVLEIPRAVVRAASPDKDSSPDLDQISAKVMLGQCIASSPLFKEMPAEVAAFLSSRGTLATIPANAVVTKQGDEDRTLYLLVRGHADVFKDDQRVGDITAGGFFGEIALIAGVPRTASVITSEESLLLSLHAEDVWSVLARNPGLSVFIETVADSRQSGRKAA